MNYPLPDWTGIYQAYDADSLATFASAGLLRRAQKDVDADKVSLSFQAADSLQFENDAQQITLDARGIQSASCSCPAQSCCKHVLAAVLWLQASKANMTDDFEVLAVEGVAVSSPHQPCSPPPPVIENNTTEKNNTALHDLLALQPQTVLKKMSKPVIRLAHQFQQLWQTQEHALHVDNQGARLKLLLPVEPLGAQHSVLFIAGAGVPGMLSDIETKYQQAAHLAAVAEIFRLHHKAWDWGSVIVSQSVQTEDSLSMAEQQIIQQAQHLIEQLVSLGLSHLDSATAKQCRLLNMSARAEGLILLAAYLRNLHGNLEELIARHEHSNERHVLLQLCSIYSYCYQLLHSQGEVLQIKRGSSRQNYTTQDARHHVQLQPLGAHWWQTAGGARGITLSFWDIQAAQLLETTLARPNSSDPNFYPRSVWKDHAIWQRSAQQLMQQAVLLSQPRFSDNGRLASTGDSTAAPASPVLPEQLNSFGIGLWRELQQQLVQHAQEADTTLPVRWLLRIKTYEQPQLDELEQCVWWRIKDEEDTTLHLRLDWNSSSMQRIEQLELYCQQQRPVKAVLVQSEASDSGWFMLEPLSLLIAQDNSWQVASLDFDQVRIKNSFLQSAALNMTGRIKQLLQRKQQQHGQQQLLRQKTLAQKVSQPVLDTLESMVASGRLLLTPAQQQLLYEQMDMAQHAGLDYLAQQLQSFTQSVPLSPAQVIRLAYVCERMQQMQRRILSS